LYMTDIKRISASELAPKLTSSKKPLLIDVREPNEYLEKHAKGSFHLPLSTLEFNTDATLPFLEFLSKNDPIYVTCRSGKRSQKAIELLQSKGVTSSLYNVDGGIEGLISASTDKSWLDTTL